MPVPIRLVKYIDILLALTIHEKQLKQNQPDRDLNNFAKYFQTSSSWAS